MKLNKPLIEIVRTWYKDEPMTDYELECIAENLCLFLYLGAKTISENKKNNLTKGKENEKN